MATRNGIAPSLEASVLKKVGDTVGKQAAMAVAASGAGISWPWRASSLLGLAAMQCVSVVLACHGLVFELFSGSCIWCEGRWLARPGVPVFL